MSPVTLRTPRLTMRQWRDTDRAPFAELCQDAEVMRHFPSPLSLDQSNALVDRCIAAIAEQGWGLWAVEHHGEFLGFTGLAVPTFEAPFLPGIEIGWRLRRSAWGNGYATEAATAALAFAFDSLHRDEVLSFTAVPNERSQAVMRRIGMSRDIHGDFDHPRVPENSPLRAHVLYRITDAEWSKTRPSLLE